METYVPSAALAKRMLQPGPVPQGRCIGQTDLRHLIELAYRLPAEGVPGWVMTQRFQIEAVAPNTANVTKSELADMLQSMLVDRFRLEVRLQVQDTRGYALVAARNGPRIKPVSGPVQLPQLTIGTGAQREGTIQGKSSMNDLAEFLVTIVSEGANPTPVTDQTNLSGIYDYSMTFPLPPPGQRGAAGGDLFDAVSQALQDQVGLQIEPRVIPAERVVIDRVEQPSEN